MLRRWLTRLGVALAGLALGVLCLGIAAEFGLMGLGDRVGFGDRRDVGNGPAALEIPDLGLTLDLSRFAEVEGSLHEEAQTRGFWFATYFGTRARIWLSKYSGREPEFYWSPGHIMAEHAAPAFAWSHPNDPALHFDVWRPLPVPIGWAPHGWFGRKDIRRDGLTAGHFAMISGQTEDAGFILRLEVDGPLSVEELADLDEWAVAAVRYSGPTQDPLWTPEEVESYWTRQTPLGWEDRRADFRVIRTDHYLVFTDVEGEVTGPLSGLLDKNYRTIQSIFVFDDVPGVRLLPVFFFAEVEDFKAWYVGSDWNPERDPERARGACMKDSYGTYNGAPDHSTHIHEQTHQIFRTRMHLTGGGSWFQEGLARYVDTPPEGLHAAKAQVAAHEGIPLETLFMMPQLSALATLDDVWQAYDQSAAVVEFCKHSSFGREGFIRWVHAVGQIARGDLPGIRRAVQRVYGVSLDEFEARFRDYCESGTPVDAWLSPAMELSLSR